MDFFLAMAAFIAVADSIKRTRNVRPVYFYAKHK